MLSLEHAAEEPPRRMFAKKLGCALTMLAIDCVDGAELPDSEVVALSELHVKSRDSTVEDILSALERVPDSIQRIVNSHKVTVKITDGNFNDLGYTGDGSNSLGVYHPGGNAYVRKEGRDVLDRLFGFGQSYGPYTALHEYGHAVDYILGQAENLSLRQEFKEVYYKGKKDRLVKILGELTKMRDLPNYSFRKVQKRNQHREETEKIKQFFAESFAQFYCSEESRAKLARKRPDVHAYFMKLEEDVNAGKYSHLIRSN